MSRDQRSNMSLDGTWFVVKGRSEPSENLTGWDQKTEHEESIGEFQPKLSYHRLVGAPIKQLSGPKDSTASCNVSKDSEIRNKIGGGLYLAAHGAPISSPAPKTPVHLSELNLADAEEWPCMGVEDVLVPQLGSWSSVVKTAAPVPAHKSESQVSPTCTFRLCNINTSLSGAAIGKCFL